MGRETPKCFVVLGMHRSATSLVAKGLAESGVWMGARLIGGSKSNPWGHYEDLDFVELNDQILAAAGGSWDDPPDDDAIEAQRGRYGGKAERLLAGKARRAGRRGSPRWGWKDPRMALTWPLYAPHLLADTHLVAVARPVGDVARSLHSRNRRISLERAETLARYYGERIARILTGWVA